MYIQGNMISSEYTVNEILTLCN